MARRYLLHNRSLSGSMWNHCAASKKAWVNDLLVFGADMIGGCKWLWQEQHWTHHAITNNDVKDGEVNVENGNKAITENGDSVIVANVVY